MLYKILKTKENKKLLNEIQSSFDELRLLFENPKTTYNKFINALSMHIETYGMHNFHYTSQEEMDSIEDIYIDHSKEIDVWLKNIKVLDKNLRIELFNEVDSIRNSHNHDIKKLKSQLEALTKTYSRDIRLNELLIPRDELLSSSDTYELQSELQRSLGPQRLAPSKEFRLELFESIVTTCFQCGYIKMIDSLHYFLMPYPNSLLLPIDNFDKIIIKASIKVLKDSLTYGNKLSLDNLSPSVKQLLSDECLNKLSAKPFYF